MSSLGIENLSHNIAIDPAAAPPMRVRPEIAEEAGDAPSFSKMLQNSFEKVNLHQAQADQAMQELVAGRTKNVHETMLSIERADLSLKLLMQVRNKVLDAYREIMRMQV